MTRKIKRLCLAFVVLAAISMSAAGSATASELHANFNGNVSIFGGQTEQHVFTTNAGTVKCEQASFEATATKVSGTQVTVSEIEMTPQYTGCQAFGQSAIIHMNGCRFRLRFSSPLTVALDITGCTTGKHIDITTAPCRMTIKPQNNIAHASLLNVHPRIRIKPTFSGITYQADGPLCPAMATGQELANGTYVGDTLVEAREDKGSAIATHNGHQYNRLLQTGALVSIQTT